MATRLKIVIARWVLRSYFEVPDGFRNRYFAENNKTVKGMTLRSLRRAYKKP